MTGIVVTAFFALLAITAGGGFALFSALNSFRAEVNQRFDSLAKEISDLKVDLARIEQKLDDHIATPISAAHPAA